MKMRAGLVVLALCVVGLCVAQSDDEPRGLILHGPGAFEGYNLFGPLDAGNTYLIDNEGRLIHTWVSDYRPGNQAYLLENGNLMRPAGFGLGGNKTFRGGGAGYRVEEFNWEGERIWEFVYASDQYLMHHDIQPMPNGNVLILAWEMKSAEEAIEAGRDAELLRQDELWPEHILEVKPIRPTGGEVVWEWHLWDHLIQDVDSSKSNYGDVAAHPELVELNPTGYWLDSVSDEERERLEALGYLGDDEDEDDSEKKKHRGSTGADWLHTNAIAYNPELDQIALSVLQNNELWILDHGTTTEEAKGHTGGRYGKGGDLLYRWGNPVAYRAGVEEDRRLYAQHDVHWIAEGLPGAGHIMLFNNGRGRPEGNYSTIVEIETPRNADGSYRLEAGKAFGPEAPYWEYTAENPEDFFSSFISGVRRLPNGNTLICVGAGGTFFEVTPDKKVVWRYVNPAVPPELTEAEKSERAESGRTGGRALGNAVYRVYRYAPGYPGLRGKDLTPGPLLTDYLKTHPATRPLEFDDEQ